MIPTAKNVMRLSGAKKEEKNNNSGSGIQLAHLKSVSIIPPKLSKSKVLSEFNYSQHAGNPQEY